MNGTASGLTFAIVVAAGRSERMGGIDKIFAPLMGRPLLAWTLGVFKRCEDIDEVIVVADPFAVPRTQQFVREWRFDKVTAVVAGGERRQDSVRAGLDFASDAAFVVVHDAARPLVTPELISAGVLLARAAGAALCAVPALDTLKEVDGDPPTVASTLDRSRVWLAQTPQVFERGLLIAAHSSASFDATDDAALVEASGHAVRIYEGSRSNIKVTTPEDLLIAEALLRERYAS